MINQCDKRFMVYSKTTACTCERLSSHSSRDFWLRCWKDRSSGICSKLHASRVTILELLAKISCNSRENSRVIPASSTQNPCEFWGFVAWKNWNIHAGYLKIRSFPTMVLYRKKFWSVDKFGRLVPGSDLVKFPIDRLVIASPPRGWIFLDLGQNIPLSV